MSENLKDILDSIKEAINKNDDSIDSFLIGTECWKELLDYINKLEEENEKIKLENKVLKEQMVAMVQPNYTYGIH